MDIVLTHIHFWEADRPRGYEEAFIRLMDEGKVSRIVAFANDLPGETTNECLAALVRRYPHRIYAVAEVAGRDRAVLRKMKEYIRAGFCGFKLFPSKCMCYADDKKMFRIYRTATDLDAPIVVHAGRVPAEFERYGLNKYAQPIALDEVAARFPELRIVISHAGNPLFEQTLMVGNRPNVHIEMTGCGVLDYYCGKALYERYGADRIINGGPLHSHAKSIATCAARVTALLKRKEIDDASAAKIMGGNAARVFRLPAPGTAA